MCARYYPHGDNRPSDWQEQSAFKMVDPLDNGLSRWLYGTDKWTETDYNRFLTLYSIPGMRQYIDYLYDSRAAKEYMARYGMDYSDIHDPRKLKSTASGVRMISWVSENIAKLYS